MVDQDVEALWFHYERAYAVLTARRPIATPERTRLTPVDALTMALGLRDSSATATVTHIVGDNGHEVDRYSARSRASEPIAVHVHVPSDGRVMS